MLLGVTPCPKQTLVRRGPGRLAGEAARGAVCGAKILDTKGTPPEEQRSRVVQITQETGTYGSLRTDLQTAGLL